jgi:hypothetical protein
MKNCMIAYHLDSTLFDHKSVRLNFRSHKQSNKQVIRDTVLNDIDLPYKVQCQVIEQYIQHAGVCDDFPIELKQTYLDRIGQLMTKFVVIRDKSIEIALGTNEPNAENLIAQTRIEVSELFETLPRSDYFESLALTCDH